MVPDVTPGQRGRRDGDPDTTQAAAAAGLPSGGDDPADVGARTGGAADPDVWPFPSERYLHEWAPAVQQAQNAWMSAIDSLRAPDRKTHELIRMVCTVILRQAGGIERHAMLAAEVGATWDEIAGSILLTEPAFGILLAVEALPAARRGFKRGAALARTDDTAEGAGGSVRPT
ncbi:MAG: carboxymuconolactone decarboxylase family protein [Actinomycetota bacterium]|jgi:alkylhydroperoxidase/carboxymuconolactone decarboxylase family protein YurZ|nr:carboxymuconolactone decarboxylase family protein [Actinomycetota bacterium]